MPDRCRRAALRLPLPAWEPSLDPGDPGQAVSGCAPLRPSQWPRPLLREPRSSAAAGGSGSEEEYNPFAAPPEGRPDQPWQPRGPQGGNGDGHDGGNGNGDGDRDEGESGDAQPPAWGSQWSSRQPDRQGGGFGTGPGSGGPGGGPEGPGRPGGLRWDPTDPVQRRARYALLAGMWSFFFALFSLPQVALLLGALAIYWGISSLRGTARTNGGAADASGAGGPGGGAGAPGRGAPEAKPQATAAISGLVTGGIALAIVAASFTFQIVYRDYFTCVDDALTQSSRQSCEQLLPKHLRPLLGGTQER